MSEKKSQKELIREHIARFGSITALEALNLYGCFRLAARISDLKKDGALIKSTPWKTPGGATIAKYSVAAPDLSQGVLPFGETNQ